MASARAQPRVLWAGLTGPMWPGRSSSEGTTASHHNQSPGEGEEQEEGREGVSVY